MVHHSNTCIQGSYQHQNGGSGQCGRVCGHDGIEKCLCGSGFLRSKCQNVRPVGGDQQHTKGGSQRNYNGDDRLDVVRYPVDGRKQRVKGTDGSVGSHRPNLRPSHWGFGKFSVGLCCGCKHGVFYNGGGDLPLCTHFAQLAHIHLQIVRNGSCNGRCLFHDAVQFIAAQHAGCKALFQLKDCSLRSLPGCAGERKLFVQLFCKLNDLLCVAKCAARHSTQL